MLLAIAVVLPTVCLLWFMTQAVKNERLAVRQKLIDVYKTEIEKKFSELDSKLEIQARYSETLLQNRPLPDLWLEFIHPGSSIEPYRADGLILYDPNGSCIYPTHLHTYQDNSEFQNDFDEAWQCEFAKHQLKEALDRYKDIENNSDDPVNKKQAIIAQARIHNKMDKIDEAIHLAGKAKETGHGDKGQIAYLRADAQLMYTELVHQKASKENQYIPKFTAALRNLLSTISNYNTGSGVLLDIPSEQRIFLANKAMSLYEQSKGILTESLNSRVERVRKLQAAESLSLQIAEKFPTTLPFKNWSDRTLNKLPQTNIYAAIYRIDGKTAIRLTKQDNIILAFAGDLTYTDKKGNIFSSNLDCQILDAQGAHIYGIKGTTAKPFLKTEISKFLPDWTIELYFKDANVFENAASKQAAIYTWTGVLVVLLILGSGAMATQVIGKQIKLNRLKNDFIATVTHELKTPLSSMRVLVDTLLEGNYNDQQQATEYLQLISKENLRLSRLIDNFLTFSRMERNKQAFDIVRTDPAEIAKAAAEAVQTKFNEKNCKFTVTIADNLASIMADKDAMVTVLVNLLDNAYKYSYDDKQIQLRVFGEEDFICFSVKDNGIGMTHRQMKKIFDRFYQADSSLSRQAEGAGLGLSIVKFIVDAHKGSVIVDSQPDKGSTFTVTLPRATRRKIRAEETSS